MELSVVIVSYNVSALLRNSLLSVKKAAEEITHEITVVDNNSADNSAEMVNREFPVVRLITSAVNEGYASACNRGIEASSGNFILILNPDTIVSPEALTRALTFMQSHPEAGAAGARMYDGQGRFLPESKRGFPSPRTSLFKLTGLGRLFPRSGFFNAYYLGNRPEDETCLSDILTGAFMFIRREALDKAGLFDTSFFMYGEDIDLSWRIVRAGYCNYYLHDVIITHLKGQSTLTADKRETNRHFYGAMQIFVSKHINNRWQLPLSISIDLARLMALARLKLTVTGKNEP